MSEGVRRAQLANLGSIGFGATISDYHGRWERQLFPAAPESWLEIADWLAKRGAVEVVAPRSLPREFVVWLATQPFAVVVETDGAQHVKIVSWPAKITATASTTGFHSYDEITTTSDDAGFVQVEEFLGRLPMAAQITLIDASGPSLALVEYLQRFGRAVEVEHVTDPWFVTIDCYPERHVVLARANGAYQGIELPNEREGSNDLVSWIQSLGPTRRIIIRDADQDSAVLVQLLLTAGIRCRLERATRGELRGEPGALFGGVQFDLALRGLGWLVVRMRIEADEMEFVVGGLTSAWHDTVNGIRAAFDASSPVVIVWSEEPGAYQLVLSRRRGGVLDVRLMFVPNQPFGKPDSLAAGDCVGRWTVGARDLANAFATASYRLLQVLPDIDLRARWSYGAPLDELELLAIRASL